MQHAAAAALLAQDPRRDVVRVEHVNDHRLAERARDPQVGAKDLLLQLALAGVAIEPALADRDRGVICEPSFEPGELVGVELGDDLRMHPDCPPHARVVMLRRQLAQRVPGARPDRRDQHPDHPGCPGPRDRRVAVGVERRHVEVAMGVDHEERLANSRAATARRRIAQVRFWSRWADWYRSSESIPATWLRAGREALLGEMPALAGGAALFALFALVPTIAAVVAIYSVVADPIEIERHLRGLETVLPQNVVAFVSEQLERQSRRSDRDLGFAVVISVGVAVFSARGAARALLDALNRAYRVRDIRSWAHKTAITIAMAFATLFGVMLMFAVVVALPAVFAIFGFDDYGIVRWLRWPALMTVLFLSMMLLYRYGPSPRPLGNVRHLWPGAAISTLLTVLLSAALSIWVDRIASYNLWYGAFGSVVVVMLWFYLSTIAIVLGGFVNAELERHAGAPAPDRSMY
jgi:membrane protein